MAEERKTPSLKKAVAKGKTVKAAEVPAKGKQEDISSLYKATGTKAEKKRIEGFVRRMAKSPTGKKILETAHEAGYSIDFALGMEGALGVCDPNKKTVSLNAACSDHENVATLAHELRHAVQFANGMGSELDRDDTKTAFMITRAMEGDAEANAALVTWELKEQGDVEPWKQFVKDGPTVARAFEETVEKVDINTPKGKRRALTAGFRGWYDNIRIRNAYDEGHIETLKMIEEEGMAGELKFDRSRTAEEIISKTCIHDGEVYFGGSPERITTKKYLSVSKPVKRELNEFMERREEKYGLKPDKTVEDIPVHSTPRAGNSKKVPIRKKPVQSILSDDFSKKRSSASRKTTVKKMPVSPMFSKEFLQKQAEARKRLAVKRKEQEKSDLEKAAVNKKAMAVKKSR